MRSMSRLSDCVVVIILNWKRNCTLLYVKKVIRHVSLLADHPTVGGVRIKMSVTMTTMSIQVQREIPTHYFLAIS